MDRGHFTVPGCLVGASDLAIGRARALACSLDADDIPFAKLIECRKDGVREVVVFELDVEVPQVRQYPIRPTELIAATFTEADAFAPIVHALRKNFPQVPHLNLHWQEYPRNLCLYDERYDDIRRRWTPPRFIHDIRRWLALTAQGKLHQEDQPLEPLLADYVGHIVLPTHLLNSGRGATKLFVSVAHRGEDGRLFVLTQATPAEGATVSMVASVHRCPPLTHGVIHRKPANLADLASMTGSTGLDLVGELRERLTEWKHENNAILEANLLLVILFPKKRHDQGEVESVDTWAFFLGNAAREGDGAADLLVRDIGTRIGLWLPQEREVGFLLRPDESRRGEDIGLDVLNVVRALDRPMAATLNGVSAAEEATLVAVGVGALGSQLVMNVARSGLGRWTLVDHDHLMPHNVARHALGGSFVGWNKAEAIAAVANDILPDAKLFSALPVDVLSPGDRAKDLSTAFANADAIVDMSTSVSVARALALNVESPARRLSVFLAPSGADLVLIAEDTTRTLTLDALEMQYYRAVLNDGCLAGHLADADGQHRYARSCRDITSTLPQNLVALHAGLAARALQETLRTPEAAAAVWRAGDDGTVQRVDIQMFSVVRQEANPWSVVSDEGLLEKLTALRATKLPNETGGVLLGSFDVDRRILYIVDALPSPPDSEEWPTLYIRGCDGLSKIVAESVQKTRGMIEYVGEWHSHPEGATPAASPDDFEVFAWLADLMSADGLPAVMLIVGHHGQTSCYVGEIAGRTNLLAGNEQ